MRFICRFFCCVSMLAGAVAGISTPAGAVSERTDADFVQLSLTQAIVEAEARNPSVQAADAEVTAARSRIIQARSGLLPQVNVTETFNRTDNPMWAFGTKLNQAAITAADFDPERLNHPDGMNNFATAVRLDWTVFNAGRTRIGVAQAESGLEIARLRHKSVVQQVIANAAKAYVGLLLAQESRNVVAQSLDTARVHGKMVHSRYSGGFVVKSDLLRARVRIAELEQALLRADSRVRVAQALLCAAMGRTDTCRVEPVTSLKRCTPLKEDSQAWIQRALNERTDLKALELQRHVGQAAVRKSKAGHLPTVNLFGAYEVNTEDFSETADNYTVGGVFRINLFSGRRISAEVVEKKASVQGIDAHIQRLKIGVSTQAKQAFLQAKSAWQQIAVARSGMEQAREGLRIVGNRYHSGLLTIVALLDAQVALQQAQNRHFQSMHDYKTARVDLFLAAGIIDNNFQ